MPQAFDPTPRMSHRALTQKRSLQFEWLESRLLLSVFTVINTDDHGDGSFRQSILDANANPGRDFIDFNIDETGPFAIRPRSPLPTIIDEVVIDGTTQPGFDGPPLIELDGFFTTSSTNGLHVVSGNSVIRGLSIYNFSGSGIYLALRGGNYIELNYLGIDSVGSQGPGNAENGLVIDNSPNNIIGGAFKNVISANQASGIFVFGSDAVYNVIAGNYVGVDDSGTYAVPNKVGITIQSPHTLVGDVNHGNVISGNSFAGILMTGGEATNNKIQSNWIGTDGTASGAIGNSGSGIEITAGAHHNRIGSDADGNYDLLEGNVISGNAGWGVEISGNNTDNNTIAGNLIGTDQNGLLALANYESGVRIVDGAQYNHIGTNGDGWGDDSERNLISGNGGSGIKIVGQHTAHNVVAGNWIGLDVTGDQSIGNIGDGVLIGFGSYSNRVGTDGDGTSDRLESNVISGNLSAGVMIVGTNTSDNVISGNWIGTDARGLNAQGNNNWGIRIADGAHNNRIGTDADGFHDLEERNVVSGNHQDGIRIEHTTSIANRISGNYIGLDASGTDGIGNRGTGILIYQSSQNVIGGSAPVSGNVISGNHGDGINLEGLDAVDNEIQGNRIGTTANGLGPLANFQNGIHLHGGAREVVIGTQGDGKDDSTEGNLISGNARSGILITDANTTQVIVAGNLIGTSKDGTTSIGNHNHGILLQQGVHAIRIGTDGDLLSDRIEGNLISGNYKNGIELTDAVTTDNIVAGNQIGTDITGSTALPNAGSGLVLSHGAYGNRIGTDGNGTADQTERNVISSNIRDGITIHGSGTRENNIAGNFIGVDQSGWRALGNSGSGIFLSEGASFNQIGSDENSIADADEANVISGNIDHGILISGNTTENNFIYGNHIGTDLKGTGSVGNQQTGVLIAEGAHNNQVGSINAPNSIAFNVSSGIAIRHTQSIDNRLRGNAIYGNGGLGIDLGLDGSTPNDVSDADPGPNALQNFPVIVSIERDTQTRIEGWLSGKPDHAFTLDFFVNTALTDSHLPEAERYLDSLTLKTDSQGHADFQAILNVSIFEDDVITATATSEDGSTSEISGAWIPSDRGRTLAIEAYIDGRDRLIIQGDSVRWHHFESAAAGRFAGGNKPTRLTLFENGDPVDATWSWLPTWPDAEDTDLDGNGTIDEGEFDELRFETSSLSESVIAPGLPPRGMVLLSQPESRDTIRIVQEPHPDNDFTLIIEFDDNAREGAQWYRADVTLLPLHTEIIDRQLNIDATDANETLVLRLDPDQPSQIQLDQDDDGIGDFTFPLVDFDAIIVHGRGGQDSIQLDESFGTWSDSHLITLRGGAGHDLLKAGRFSETLFGGPGNDTLIAGDGDDWLDGDGGQDQLTGSAGNDRVDGGDRGDGTWILSGTSENDFLDLRGYTLSQESVLERRASNDGLVEERDVGIRVDRAELFMADGRDHLVVQTGGPLPLHTSVHSGLESADNLIENSTFDHGPESDKPVELPEGSSKLPNWEIVGNSVGYRCGLEPLSRGICMVELGGSSKTGGIRQIFPTETGTRYLVTFDFAGHPDLLDTHPGLQLSIDGETVHFTLDASRPRGDFLDWQSRSWAFVAQQDTTTLELSSLPVSVPNEYGTLVSGVRLVASTYDSIHFYGSQGDDYGHLHGDQMTLAESVFSVHAVDFLEIHMEAGSDQLQVTDYQGAFFGGSGDDLLSGSSIGVYLDGQQGNDTLNGSTGSDSLTGGEGNDWIAGFEGNDILDGGMGEDTLKSGDGFDTVTGGPGIDVWSLLGSDQFSEQFLISGDNEGGLFVRRSHVHDGDLIETDRGSSVEEIQTRAMGGHDILNLTTLSFDEAHTAGLNAILLEGGTGNDLLRAPNYPGVTLKGGEGDDTLVGNLGGDVLIGGPGADTINGRGGSDQLFGNQGDDLLRVGLAGTGRHDNLLDGGSGNDRLFGFNGDDTLRGGTGNDILRARPGDDLLEGGEGNDVLDAGNGEDTLHGNAGNDTLQGKRGNDLLHGDLGDDVLVNTIVDEGDDTLSGGLGNDLARFKGMSFDEIFHLQWIPEDTLNAVSGHVAVTQYDGRNPDAPLLLETQQVRQSEQIIIAGFGGADWIDFSDFTDQDFQDAEITSLEAYGGGGQDTLWGSAGPDYLFGGGARDQLYGHAGNDTLDGGPGFDSLYGGSGDDSLIILGSYSTHAEGGTGDDTLDARGSTAPHVLSGDAGNDLVYGGSGDDQIQGGSGNDTLAGGDGSDTISGNTGDDHLFGEDGDDLLDGGDGDDTIDGGDGYDTAINGEVLINCEPE